MRIKRLNMHGFKSFVDPTEVDFDLPVISIVGPNGTGKSNVVDAIRWVMGEMSAKHLRGKSMEDVIFNGSSKRAALGMASVSLTFSTEDGLAPAQYSGFSEITVTRRLYRSGESEYLINKVACRLRDIHDLFLGTGAGTKAYSVIEQGRIDFAVNARPEDRRRMIEEAAGVSKFKTRRDAALRRMEGTQGNLLRLGDILAEIRRQIRSLERQVKKAERFKKIRDELRDLELYVFSKGYLHKSSQLADLKHELNQWQEREGAQQTQLEQNETDIESQRLELADLENKLSKIQETLFERNNQKQLGDAEQQYKRQEIESLTTQSERWELEKQEASQRLAILQEEVIQKEKEAEGIKNAMEDAQKILASAETEWTEANQKKAKRQDTIESNRQNIARLGQELAAIESQLSSIQEQQHNLKERLRSRASEQESLKQQQEELSDSLSAAEQSLAALRLQNDQLASQQVELEEQLAAGYQERDIKQNELTALQEELLHKRSRLRSLVELDKSLHGYAKGVRTVMKSRKEQGMDGIKGLVADFIKMDPRYEEAVLAALGDKLQFIIMNEQNDGMDAIKFLKEGNAGRSCFIPKSLKKTKKHYHMPQSEGVLGRLLHFINISDDYRDIGEYLFGDVMLVDTLERAVSLWKSLDDAPRLVTLDGDYLDPSGIMSGGQLEEDSTNMLANRREIEALRREIVRLEQEIGLKEDSVSQMEGSLSEVAMREKSLAQELQTLAVRKASLEKDLYHHKDTEKRQTAQLELFSSRAEQLQQELAAAIDRQVELRESRETAMQRQSDITLALHTLQADERELETMMAERTESLTKAKIMMSSVEEKKQTFQTDFERIQGLKKELEERLAHRSRELAEAQERRVRLQGEIETLATQVLAYQNEIDELKKTQAESQEIFNRQRTELQERELQLRAVRKEVDEAKEQSSEYRIKLTRLEGDLHHLLSQVSDRYSLNLAHIAAEWESRVPECEHPEERAEELREKIEKMGDVNMAAIPEFEDLKEREGFLTQQHADLEDSLEKLKKVIRKINQTTKQRFEETFKQVQERFTGLFPQLFEGGKAALTLENPEDLLNTGVHLMIQPPGKRLSHISLLSGGEKAMAAVCFIFSIFLVKPSPFCILDEVDAPLDDTNARRFHHLIKQMTHRTQFILITHNKITMEIADGLFGVTMQEPGVSKVVSVRMDSLPEEKRVASA